MKPVHLCLVVSGREVKSNWQGTGIHPDETMLGQEGEGAVLARWLTQLGSPTHRSVERCPQRSTSHSAVHMDNPLPVCCTRRKLPWDAEVSSLLCNNEPWVKRRFFCLQVKR